MRRFLLVFTAAAAATVALAAHDSDLVGTYRLVPSAEMRRDARRNHHPVAAARLQLRSNHTFRFQVDDGYETDESYGLYRVRGGHLEFRLDEGSGLHLPDYMELDGDALLARGLVYARLEESRPRLDEVGPSRDRDSYEPVRPRVRDDAEDQPTREDARRARDHGPSDDADRPVQVERPRRDEPRPVVHVDSVEGSWILVRNGQAEPKTHFTFTKNGKFRYGGEAASSAGSYRLTDCGLELTWSEIDGQPVEDGAKIHKTIPFTEDGQAFYVDDYRYERGR